jgi:hypothetical protein
MRSLTFHARPLSEPEVAALTQELKMDSQQKTVSLIVDRLIDMGIDSHIAMWAASNAEGGDLEDKFMNALNKVYSE